MLPQAGWGGSIPEHKHSRPQLCGAFSFHAKSKTGQTVGLAHPSLRQGVQYEYSTPACITPTHKLVCLLHLSEELVLMA